VCVWKEKRAIDPSQRKKKKTEHRQLLSKSKQRSVFWINQQKKRDTSQTIHSTHTHIHRPVWNERERKNYRQTYRSKLQ